ncbi:MAG TPA: hypothetical protein VK631_22210 [Solirubrobacteraceae bacterium]|nr:hypothetical protein [Solirubrobacteraceae bacterium]
MGEPNRHQRSFVLEPPGVLVPTSRPGVFIEVSLLSWLMCELGYVYVERGPYVGMHVADL